MNLRLPIQDYLSQYANLIDQELRSILPIDWDIPDLLRQSMDYSLMAGGKRIRPILVLAAAEALGSSLQAAMPAACAVEMIHTYSLIHDDLPAMDNDDYRRGKLTNHKVYGEAMAILAGDALLTHAFYQIAQAAAHAGCTAEQIVSIIRELAEYSGAKGMVGGQAADMLGEQGITDLQQLEYIHSRKTSDLIAFSLRAGGIMGKASKKQLDALTTFGSNIGLAFQIQDDILDVAGNEEKLGKPIRSDEKSKKVTYPYFIGLDESRKLVSELTRSGKEAIREAGFENPDRLLQIADFLVQRDH